MKFNITNCFILILLLIIIYLYQDNKLSEHYMTYLSGDLSGDKNTDTINEVESPLGLSSALPPTNKAVYKNFGNFGIIGSFPAIPICNSCGLEFGCTPYPYNSDDRSETVCRKCKSNMLATNYSDLSKPIYVYARSVGKPRQCRQINK